MMVGLSLDGPGWFREESEKDNEIQSKQWPGFLKPLVEWNHIADILELLADFGCTSECDADLNGDGATNVNDILQILAAFGGDCE